MDIASLIANVGAPLGLALFAIWILERSHKEQLKREGELRQRLEDALERNTEAWVAATTAMVTIGDGMRSLVTACAVNSQELGRLRVLLARRPCVAEAAEEQVVGGE